MSGGGGAACTNGMAHSSKTGTSHAGGKRRASKMKTLGAITHDGAIIVPQMAPS
jgi:hypothetical protein